MTFTNPVYLWAFFSLLPLAVIYLLKVRPNRKTTTAYFLWESGLRQKQSRRLFHRMRDLLSLLLMMLAFSAVILSLAGPQWSAVDRKDMVILVDNSVSMNAKNGGVSKLEQARQRARNIVTALDGRQRCSLATVSDRITFLSNLTDNPRELLEAIDRIPRSFTSGDPKVLESLEEMLTSQSPTTEPKPSEEVPQQVEGKNDLPVGSSTGYRVLVLTDGGIQVPTTEPTSPGPVTPEQEPTEVAAGIDWEPQLMGSGSSDSNIGIVACDLQHSAVAAKQAQLFFQLLSTAETSLDLELEVAFNSPDNLVKLIPVQVVPGQNPPEVFTIDEAEPGKWFLKLSGFPNESADQLEDDNLAFLYLPPVEPIPVSIHSQDRYFFENSILAFQQANDLLNLVPADQSDIVVCQGEVPDNLTSDLLIFQPQGESKWWKGSNETFDAVIPRALVPSHPIIRHLEVASMAFLGAQKIVPPAGAEILVQAEDDTPLIFRTTRAGQTAVVVNLDPIVSEFYFSTRFPVLIYSVAMFLAGQDQPKLSGYPVGSMVPVPSSWADREMKIEGPDTLQQSQSAELPYRVTSPGFYQFRSGDQEQWIAASVLSREESRLPKVAVQKEDDSRTAAGWSPATWLTTLAMIVLVAESFLYQRRKVG